MLTAFDGSSPPPPRVPAVRYSSLGGSKISAYLPRQSQMDIDDDDDMTEMNMTSVVTFADLPLAIELPQSQDNPPSKRRYATLPVIKADRSKSSSELAALSESSDGEEGHISRSSSCPTRRGEKGSTKSNPNSDQKSLAKLSNRAKLLPRPPSDDDYMYFNDCSSRESFVQPASSSSSSSGEMFNYERDESPPAQKPSSL